MTRQRPASRSSMTRQRAWALKQVAEGNCKACGKPRERWKVLCNRCAEKWRDYQRQRRNSEQILSNLGC